MAVALYRKYRPATFGEVVGQEHVTAPLRTALQAGRVNHAYLFSGPRGCGKTSSARILARSLNCRHGPTPDPCGECDSCVALAPDGPGSVDVVELDAASHGGVDDARELRDKAFFAPADARYRVFIVDEAHMVTSQGFNALLKIVEEPPEHLVFVFATTEPDKVISTIRSRTHHYPFRLLPPGTMRGLLERICDEEQVEVEPAVYPLVIRAGGGSPRDSLSVLDQLLSGADDSGVTYERAMALLGVTDLTLLGDMVEALIASDAAAVYSTVDRLVEAGHDPRRFTADLLERFRDLTVLQAVPEAAERGLVDAPEDSLTAMSSQADRLGAASVTRYSETLHTGLLEMRGATAPRLLLELLCARMLLPAASPDDAALLQRLERVERRMSVSAPETAAASGAASGGDAGGQDGHDDGPAPRFVRPSRQQGDAEPEQPTADLADRVAQQPVAEASTEPEPAPVEPEPEPAPAAPEPEPAPAAPEPEPAEPEPASGTASDGLDAAGIRRIWPQLLEEVKQRSRTTQVMLSGATVARVEEGVLVLQHASEPLSRRLSESHNAGAVAGALQDVLGVDWQVRCELESAAAGAGHTGAGSAGNRQRGSGPAVSERPSPAAPASGQRSDSGPTSGDEQAPAGSTVPDTAASSPSVGSQQPVREAGPPTPAGQQQVSEEEMLAEADAEDTSGGGQRRDPHDVAMQLLSDELGARPLE